MVASIMASTLNVFKDILLDNIGHIAGISLTIVTIQYSYFLAMKYWKGMIEEAKLVSRGLPRK